MQPEKQALSCSLCYEAIDSSDVDVLKCEYQHHYHLNCIYQPNYTRSMISCFVCKKKLLFPKINTSELEANARERFEKYDISTGIKFVEACAILIDRGDWPVLKLLFKDAYQVEEENFNELNEHRLADISAKILMDRETNYDTLLRFLQLERSYLTKDVLANFGKHCYKLSFPEGNGDGEVRNLIHMLLLSKLIQTLNSAVALEELLDTFIYSEILVPASIEINDYVGFYKLLCNKGIALFYTDAIEQACKVQNTVFISLVLNEMTRTFSFNWFDLFRLRVSIKLLTWWHRNSQVYEVVKRFMANSMVFNLDLQREIFAEIGLERWKDETPPGELIPFFKVEMMKDMLRKRKDTKSDKYAWFFDFSQKIRLILACFSLFRHFFPAEYQEMALCFIIPFIVRFILSDKIRFNR